MKQEKLFAIVAYDQCWGAGVGSWEFLQGAGAGARAVKKI